MPAWSAGIMFLGKTFFFDRKWSIYIHAIINIIVISPYHTIWHIGPSQSLSIGDELSCHTLYLFKESVSYLQCAPIL